MDGKNRLYEKKYMRLEDFCKDQAIPFLEGRPERDNTICDDDITNLIIALHTSDDFNDFINHI